MKTQRDPKEARKMVTIGRMLVIAIATVLLLFSAVKGNATTLEDLLSGGTLTQGDKTFGDFTFQSNNTSEVSASGILVSTGFDGFGNIAIIFSGDMVAASDTDFLISYTVSTTSGAAIIEDITQAFQLSSGGAGGSITIAETACSSPCPTDQVASSNVSFVFPNSDTQDPPGELIQGDNLIINPPLATIYVLKDINLDVNSGGTVGTSRLVQGFSQTQVPEPASLLLLGSGLVGLAYFARRRMK